MPKNHIPTADRIAARKARKAEAAKISVLEERNKEWLFGAFWLALNAELAKQGYPETGFRGAREAWESSIEIAKLHPAYSAPAQN